MARGNPRLDRAVQQGIADILEDEISDPRLGLVTITEVSVTPDQRYATVYYSVLDQDVVSGGPGGNTGDPLPTPADAAEGFEAARSRIQGLLGRRLNTRLTPELRFEPDPVADQAARVEDLIRRVRSEDERG